MVARCNDGDFSMSMNGATTFPAAMDMMNTDVYMIGDLMNYPDAMSDPTDPTMTMILTTLPYACIRKETKTIAQKLLSDRRFVATESVDTPAGPFTVRKLNMT